MANTDDNTVQLSVSATSPYREGMLTGSTPVLPGKLLENTDDEGIFAIFSAAGERTNLLFARENIYSGKSIYNFTYSGDRVFFRQLRRGDVYLAWLQPPGSIAIGAWLSTGDLGNLKKFEEPDVVGSLVGVALENLGTISVDTRIKVEIV